MVRAHPAQEELGPSLGSVLATVFGRAEDAVVAAKGYKHGVRIRFERLSELSHGELCAIESRLYAVPREDLTQLARSVLLRVERMLLAMLLARYPYTREGETGNINDLVAKVFGSPRRIVHRCKRHGLRIRREYFRGMDYAAVSDIEMELSDTPRGHLGPRERAFLLKLEAVVLEELLERTV